MLIVVNLTDESDWDEDQRVASVVQSRRRYFDLAQGGFAILPHGMVHSCQIQIANDSPVRLLVVTAPVQEGLSGGRGGFVGEMESGIEE